MKVTLQKSERYRGFQVNIDEKEESLIVEHYEGKPVVRLILEDFLNRVGATSQGFKGKFPRLDMGGCMSST